MINSRKAIAYGCLIYALNSFSETIRYCDYKVKEGDKLDTILSSYMQKNGVPKDQLSSSLYSKDGLLASTQKVNQLDSVNQLKIGQIILIPCSITKSKQTKDVPLKSKKDPVIPKKFSYDLNLQLQNKYVKSQDKINSSQGNISIFPSLTANFYANYPIASKVKAYITAGYTYNTIDEPDINKTLSRSNLSYENYGLGLIYQTIKSAYSFELINDNAPFFVAQNSQNILVDAYNFLRSALSYTYSLTESHHFRGQAAYLSSNIIGEDAFSQGYTFSLSYILKGKTVSIIPKFEYESLETLFEKQENYNSTISVRFSL